MELKKSLLSVAAGATAMTLALGSMGVVSMTAYAEGETETPTTETPTTETPTAEGGEATTGGNEGETAGAGDTTVESTKAAISDIIAKMAVAANTTFGVDETEMLRAKLANDNDDVTELTEEEMRAALNTITNDPDTLGIAGMADKSALDATKALLKEILPLYGYTAEQVEELLTQVADPDADAGGENGENGGETDGENTGEGSGVNAGAPNSNMDSGSTGTGGATDAPSDVPTSQASPYGVVTNINGTTGQQGSLAGSGAAAETISQTGDEAPVAPVTAGIAAMIAAGVGAVMRKRS